MPSLTNQSRAGLPLATLAGLALLAVGAFAVMRGPALTGATPEASAVVVTATPQTEPTPGAPGAANDGLKIVESSTPADDAFSVLALKYGVLCTNASDATFREDPEQLKAFDEKIAREKTNVGWVERDKAFMGSSYDAAAAFGAADAFASETSTWIIVPGDSPFAVELREQVTPAGNRVWTQMNWATAC